MHSWEILLKAYRGQRPQSRDTFTAFQPHLPPHPTTVLYLESSRGEQGSVFKKSGRGREYSKGGEGEHPRAPPLHAPQHYTTSQSDTLMTTPAAHCMCRRTTPSPPPIQPPSSYPAPSSHPTPPPIHPCPSSHAAPLLPSTPPLLLPSTPSTLLPAPSNVHSPHAPGLGPPKQWLTGQLLPHKQRTAS